MWPQMPAAPPPRMLLHRRGGILGRATPMPPTPLAAPRRRHRGLALCCRGWHRLVCSSPMLLRSVSVSIPNTPAFMTRLRSLCQWLLRRAAPHMEQLRLRLSHEAAGAWNDVESQWWRLDFTTTLAAAMAACGMHGRLRDLSLQLDIDFSIHLGSWMAPLASLQRLTVTLADGIVILAGSLRCLSVLQHLSIAAFPYSFSTSTTWQAGSALPASLTSLCLGGEEGARMLPAQVRIRGWAASAGGEQRQLVLQAQALPACHSTSNA